MIVAKDCILVKNPRLVDLQHKMVAVVLGLISLAPARRGYPGCGPLGEAIEGPGVGGNRVRDELEIAAVRYCPGKQKDTIDVDRAILPWY